MGKAGILGSVALAMLVAACTPFGFARGDFWTGKSTGDLGGCVPFDFHLVVEDGRIGGYATSEFEWGTAQWDLRGLVGPDRRVTLETRPADPRVPQPSLTWTGTYNPLLWEITLGPDAACPTPRTTRLQRR